MLHLFKTNILSSKKELALSILPPTKSALFEHVKRVLPTTSMVRALYRAWQLGVAKNVFNCCDDACDEYVGSSYKEIAWTGYFLEQ